MLHPISKRFKGVRGQFAPNTGNLAIEQRPGHFIQLITHANLTSQGLVEK